MDTLRGAVPDAQAATGQAVAPSGAVLRGVSPGGDGVALARTPSGKPMNNLELVENLCAVSPSLREARRLHVQSFGTLIPHVFMAAVLARVGQCLLRGPGHPEAEHRPEMEGILAALEQAMKSGDRETRNVVAISFVRDSEVEAFFADLKQWLGPKTLGQVRGR